MAEEQDDRIGHFVSRPDLDSDKDYIIATLNEVKTVIVDINKTKLALFGDGSLRDIQKDLAELMKRKRQKQP
jgi:sulfate adenylyltransferase subunit 1 (EFTu-like GTPase family)